MLHLDRKNKYLILFSISTVALLLSFSSYNFVIYSKILTQFPAGGLSFWKPRFLWIWLSFVFLCAAFTAAQTPETRSDFRRLLLVYCFAGALNLLAHLWFSLKLGIGLFDYVVAAADSFVSSNMYQHTHVLKSTIALIVASLGLEQYLRADIGWPYYKFFPLWVEFLALALATVFIVYALKYLRKKTHTAELCLQAIILFILLKSIFDGGPLSSEVIGLVPIILAIAYPQVKKFIIAYHWVVAVIVVTVVLILIPESAFRNPFWALLKHSQMLHLIVLAFYLWIEWGKANKLNLVRYLLIALLLSGGAKINSNLFFWHELKHLEQEVRRGDNIYFTAYFNEAFPGEVIYRDGSLKIYRFTVERSKKLWDYYAERNLPVGYRFIAVDGVNCDAKNDFTMKGSIYSAVSPVATGLITQTSMLERQSIFTKFNLTKCEAGQGCSYRYHAQVRGCVSGTAAEVIINRLRSSGLNFFVIVPETGFSSDD